MQTLETQKNSITCLVIDNKKVRKEKWRTILKASNFDMFFLAHSINGIDANPENSNFPEEVDVVFIHASNEMIWKRFSGRENLKQAKFEFVFDTSGNPTVTGKQISITKPSGDKDLSITEGDINQVIDYIKDPRSDNLPNMCKLEKNSDYYWNELGNRDINKVEDKKRQVQEIFEFIFLPKKEE
jgi:hypothetical protein